MLNLFNHVLALFCIKFACILAIRCPLFRWELCKGYVWESVKKTQDVCIQRSLATSKSPKWHTCEAAGNWRVTTARALQDKIYSLARQLACDSNLQLVLLARLSCQNALFGWKMTFRIPHIRYNKYPYTHEM